MHTSINVHQVAIIKVQKHDDLQTLSFGQVIDNTEVTLYIHDEELMDFILKMTKALHELTNRLPPLSMPTILVDLEEQIDHAE